MRAEPSPEWPTDPLVATLLSAEQLELLGRYGEIRPTQAGQVLFREGDRSSDFVVILSGLITLVDHQAGMERGWSQADRASSWRSSAS